MSESHTLLPGSTSHVPADWRGLSVSVLKLKDGTLDVLTKLNAYSGAKVSMKAGAITRMASSYKLYLDEDNKIRVMRQDWTGKIDRVAIYGKSNYLGSAQQSACAAWAKPLFDCDSDLYPIPPGWHPQVHVVSIDRLPIEQVRSLCQEMIKVVGFPAVMHAAIDGRELCNIEDENRDLQASRLHRAGSMGPLKGGDEYGVCATIVATRHLVSSTCLFTEVTWGAAVSKSGALADPTCAPGHYNALVRAVHDYYRSGTIVFAKSIQQCYKDGVAYSACMSGSKAHITSYYDDNSDVVEMALMYGKNATAAQLADHRRAEARAIIWKVWHGGKEIRLLDRTYPPNKLELTARMIGLVKDHYKDLPVYTIYGGGDIPEGIADSLAIKTKLEGNRFVPYMDSFGSGVCIGSTLYIGLADTAVTRHGCPTCLKCTEGGPFRTAGVTDDDDDYENCERCGDTTLVCDLFDTVNDGSVCEDCLDYAYTQVDYRTVRGCQIRGYYLNDETEYSSSFGRSFLPDNPPSDGVYSERENEFIRKSSAIQGSDGEWYRENNLPGNWVEVHPFGSGVGCAPDEDCYEHDGIYYHDSVDSVEFVKEGRVPEFLCTTVAGGFRYRCEYDTDYVSPGTEVESPEEVTS